MDFVEPFRTLLIITMIGGILVIIGALIFIIWGIVQALRGK